VRLTLGLGAGENLNKHISWRIVPAAAMRYESLRRRWRSPGDLGRRDGDVSGQACGLHRWATWEAAGLDEPLVEGETRTGFLLCRSLLLPRRGDTVR
jgi:hypothetical protein